MNAININKNNFYNEVVESDRPVLLDFWAPWCGPCQALLPVIDEFAGENPDIKVGKVNVSDEGELARQFGVLSVPALFVVKDGKVVKRAIGARPKEALRELVQ